MINLILFGPPGSGKGTQATKLSQKYGLLHISTGDLFRYEMGNNTPLGVEAKRFIDKGKLVPDTITIGMLKNKVNTNPDVKGYIFDGFPRNEFQAKSLDDFLKEKNSEVTGLVALDVDDEEIVKRISLRGQTSGRADDNSETIIRKRIAIYKDETTPVMAYYDKFGKAVKINGIGSIDEIFNRLCNAVDAMK